MGRKEQDERIKQVADETVAKLKEKLQLDNESAAARYRKELEDKRSVQLAAEQEALSQKHLIKDEKGNVTGTLWDDVSRKANEAIEGQASYVSSRSFALIKALAEAVTVSFQQTMGEWGVLAFISSKIREKLGDNDLTPKKDLDMPEYHVQFIDGKVEVAPLKINGHPMAPCRNEQGEDVSETLNKQFNVLVQLWLLKNGYRPSPNRAEKGVYVKVDDPSVKLTEDDFNFKVNKDEKSLKVFLEAQGLEFKFQPEEEEPRPSPRPF